MKYLIDYIQTFGNLDFTEKRFNEIDALIFSQLAYNGFEETVDDEKTYLCDVAMRFYSLHSEEEIASFIGIAQNAAELLKECAKTKRFGYARVFGYINSISNDIDKQFCAVSFLLDDQSLLVAFRGTDITVTGVKESAMLSYMFPVPAQIEALYYFQETAMREAGSIRICGHSKGGNLAVFAGVTAQIH